MYDSEADKLKRKASHIIMNASVPSLVHELKQPLTAIRSNAQAAQRFLALASPDLVELRAILTDIIAATRHAEQLLQQGGSCGTHAPPARVPLDVNTLLQQVVHRLRHEAAEHHVTITLELDADLPTIIGDPLQLHQLVVNLIVNAFEAMHQTPVRPCRLVIRTARQDPRQTGPTHGFHQCGIKLTGSDTVCPDISTPDLYMLATAFCLYAALLLVELMLTTASRLNSAPAERMLWPCLHMTSSYVRAIFND